MLITRETQVNNLMAMLKWCERAMFKGNAEEDFAKALKYKEFMEVGV